MDAVEAHYERLLADIYTWMSGGTVQKVEDNRRLFVEAGITPEQSRKVLDLGCGSGFQALALAELGFNVVAVDTSASLLSELGSKDERGMITPIQADMREPARYQSYGPFELAVCMGDSIVHLQSFEEVASCIKGVHNCLERGGRFIVSFRDLTGELRGIDRAIPVRLDNDRLMATFLEYEPEHVTVNDMLFFRKDSGWEMKKSSYRKLRLSPARLTELLSELGFTQIRETSERGFTTIFAMHA